MFKKSLIITSLILTSGFCSAFVPTNTEYSLADSFAQKIDSISLKKGGNFRENTISLLETYSAKAQEKTKKKFLFDRIVSLLQNNEVTTKVLQNIPSDSFLGGTIRKTDIEDLKSYGYFKGDKNSRYMILEYSDFLCPFCKSQHDNGIATRLLERYNDISYSFRQFPLSFHVGASKIAENVECNGVLYGINAYYSAIDYAFSNDMNIEDNTQTSACPNDELGNVVQRHIDRGVSLFGIEGTPSTIIIDTKYGVFSQVVGAYPIEAFTKAIEQLKDLYK